MALTPEPMTGEFLTPVLEFLRVRTPESWVAAASQRIPELLVDHANCELKAASTALGIIYRYPERLELVSRMSKLAREELRHFEQVRRIMHEMQIPFVRLSASRYAGELRKSVSKIEPERIIDLLITSALIEARSCERFASVAPSLPEQLKVFYLGLLKSEARHYEHYLDFARTESSFAGNDDFEQRVSKLRQLESDLIIGADPQFRFHSGMPV